MKISVFIPTIDRFEYLREALQSVLDQDMPVDEVLVSDNGPKRTAEVVIAEFPSLPIKHVVHKSRMPVDKHWLWGFSEANGDLICLLEDDNLWRTNHVSSLVSAMERYPNAPLACTGAIEFRERSDLLQAPVNAPVLICDLLTQDSIFLGRKAALGTYLFNTDATSSTFMFRKLVYTKINPQPIGIDSAHDRWLWAQLAAGGGLVYIPRLTVLYRQHESMLSQSINGSKYRREQNLVTKLIIDLTRQSNLTPTQLYLDLKQHLTPRSINELTRNLVRDRNIQSRAELLPVLLNSNSVGSKYMAIFQGVAYWGWRFLQRKCNSIQAFVFGKSK